MDTTTEPKAEKLWIDEEPSDTTDQLLESEISSGMNYKKSNLKINISNTVSGDDLRMSNGGDTDKYPADLTMSPMSPSTYANADGDINIRRNDYPLSPNTFARRTLFDRTFGKLDKGGVRTSIFALCASAIGGGILNLSYVMELSGYGLTYILFVIGCSAGVWSCLMLAYMADKFKCNNYD